MARMPSRRIAMQNTVTPMEMWVGSQIIAAMPFPFMGPRATMACQASAATVSQCSTLMARCQRGVRRSSVISVRRLLPGLKVDA